MLPGLRLLPVLLCLICFFSSCDKNVIPSPIAEEESDSSGPEPDVPRQKLILTGNSEGVLIIDGETQPYACNITLAIQAGQYNSVVIRNLHGSAGCPFRIENEGLVEFVGYRKTMAIANVSHIVISGDGSEEIQNGFVFRDNKHRAVELSGDINHFVYQHAEFKNVADYVISYNPKKIYDGSTASYSQDIKFAHLKATNTGRLIHFSGGISGSEITGLVRKLEVSNTDVSNCPSPGDVIYVGMVEDYDIFGNVFSDINTQNNNHNAMFHLIGNGKFHNNHISNHQGNAIRAWAVSVGNTPKEVHIFNNIVFSSRKYSAFETQSFARMMIPQQTTYANVKVYHNTCGRLNLSQDWYGVVLDAYRLLGGTCEVYNNLAYNLPTPHPKSPIVSYLSMELDKLNESNNSYFATASAAGIIDEKNFRLSTKSEAYRNGSPNFLAFDFYRTQRNTSSPSIGAVE
ncbi:hypothetical protein ACFQRK_05395 [Parapedobacter sp. GCM10030251]|uniref:hypothetical protein n=1 Tax=Parapedobacter sp. GCM10030251 TaxID=3273419 RepID=UPI00361D4832